MDAYLEKDLDLAHQAWLKKNDMIVEAKSIMEEFNHEDKDRMKDILRIVDNCKDMAGLIWKIFLFVKLNN